MIRALVACVVLVGGACKDGETTDETIEAKGSPQSGSAGGFAASLEAELAGSGSGAKPAAGSSAAPATGSDSGSAAPAAGSNAGSGAGSAAKPGAGSGSAAASAAKPGAGSAAVANAGSATSTPGAGSATSTPGAGSAAKPGAGSAAVANAGSATSTPGAGSATPPKPVVVPAELKAIKLSLLPNWDRDLDEAGTISLAVKVQQAKGPDTFVFKFHYGYDAPGAPADREAYKKFLTDKKIFTSLADRQLGAAWYLEGTDPSGPAFRFLVNYSGKRLVCYGSLYKNSGLGDTRDEVIIQAKKICESLAL